MFDEYLTEKAEQMLMWTEPKLGQMMLGSVKRISHQILLHMAWEDWLVYIITIDCVIEVLHISILVTADHYTEYLI